MSIILYFGRKPRVVKYSIFFLNAVMIVVSAVLVIGVARIAFDDQSYKIKMALFPSMLRSGKFPVRSTYILPCLFSTYAMLKNKYAVLVSGTC